MRRIWIGKNGYWEKDLVFGGISRAITSLEATLARLARLNYALVVNWVRGMNDYLEKSGKAMLAACLTYDNARTAEKMADWHCVGEDNEAWKQGPYLSAGANQRKINRSHPYCFKTSYEFRVVAGILMGPNPERSENGGVKIPLPPKDLRESRVEPVISKLAIIEQFELFKEFLMTFDGPYNRKRCDAWEGRVEKIFLVQRRSSPIEAMHLPTIRIISSLQ